MSGVALWLWVLAFGSPGNSVRPDPALAPEQVVRIVVEALRSRNSPSPNAGIYTVYGFASPANHTVTGPYGHFLGLVKSPNFASLLGSEPVEIRRSRVVQNDAEVQVVVHSKRAGDRSFGFRLHRQENAPYRGCWMVDGVARE